MINHWWVTRPKRHLDSVSEVLGTFSEDMLNKEWDGQLGRHLDFEQALEQAGLKRIGERRDQRGGGARTYAAWLKSLGLIFKQTATSKMKLTLAGEAIMNGASPVKILKNQILKYQFPSSFSLDRNVEVASRFKIKPFIFLLSLLKDDRIKFITQEEIAKIIIVEAENNSRQCYENVVARILSFREDGDKILASDFKEKYASTRSLASIEKLMDVANTIVNWLEYTQLARRDENKNIKILADKANEVDDILENVPAFIDRPENEEYFQRKYGLDPDHVRDNRNLSNTGNITPMMIAESKIKQAFVTASLNYPIIRITNRVIDEIAENTGIHKDVVEDVLSRLYPHGAVGAFMSKYFEMAFKGRDEAVLFEKATAELFKNVFNFKTQHVGPLGKTPDILLVSDDAGFSAIMDNKAYSAYSISNDHRNRMVDNYIPAYSNGEYPLAFFSYIAGGFGTNINCQIQEISNSTGVKGSAISVLNLIKMVEKQIENSCYPHGKIRDIFSLNRRIMLNDL